MMRPTLEKLIAATLALATLAVVSTALAAVAPQSDPIVSISCPD